MGFFNEVPQMLQNETIENRLALRIQVALCVRKELTETPPATAEGRRALRRTETVFARCMEKLSERSDESQSAVVRALTPPQNGGRSRKRAPAETEQPT